MACIAAEAQERGAQDRLANKLFDQPLRHESVKIAADPQAHGKGVLNCFYYPQLMIKEASYDDDKGASLLAFTTLQKRDPTCELAAGEYEKQIENWGGYFLGVKENYVFFTGDDLDGNGTPFAIYTRLGDRLLMDSGVLHAVELTTPARDPEARPWYENPLVLRYRRSYLASCSLRIDESACWKTIQRLTGLAQAAPPSCSAAYEAQEKSYPAQKASIRSAPSYIDYEVEATLDERGVIRIAPIGAAQKCYPAL